MPLLGTHQSGEQHLPQLEASHVIAVATEDDVSATAGHVGGDGDRTGSAGLGDDLRLPLHVFRLCVEQVVGHLLLSQQGGEKLRLLDAGGADQNRPARAVNFSGLECNGTPFSGLGAEHLIRPIRAGAGAIGGNDRDF